ncbi:glycosyltransferase involved in cell wall biosynthesis [Pseudarthrobacter defluvii]|uniref:glycosyltransferase n=1 Tax=Pseudarthrobacter defluvii TaxID=410837 RepID=UPI002783CC58|nr:glycosyltransferase [Pseudarthrobacter defluvii]MDQ0771325.1 glycosyltransferase involved in cell wall biosynthesis [Pseudarthrobacter defluvii]
MKILVYAHDLGVGGSQLNAIELAGALQRDGHEAVIFGRPGPLVDIISDLGLEFVPAPILRRRPSVAAIRDLVALSRRRQFDVLHGYEWPPALECYLAARQLAGTVAVSTVLSMRVAPFIPAHLPLAVGTRLIADTESSSGRTRIALMEPPVDTEVNRPGLALGQAEFKKNLKLEPDTYVVSLVSRLAHQLKLEGILTAMEVVADLSRLHKVTLLVAGDGPAQAEVAKRAAQVNQQSGRRTVILLGELSDPRPVYDVADVCLGMGGSALKALSFAKPLVVQGEGGFWELLTPSSLPTFLFQGWYGAGSDPTSGRRELGRILTGLLPAEELRKELGTFGLQVVQSRFSLHRAKDVQLAIYSDAVRNRQQPAKELKGDVIAASRFMNYETRRIASRIMGRSIAEDFNARPLTGPLLSPHYAEEAPPATDTFRLQETQEKPVRRTPLS